MESIKVTADTLRKLARYDTPTICNVIELFDVRPRTAGYMDGRIQAAFPICRRWSATPPRRRSAARRRRGGKRLRRHGASRSSSFAELAGPAVVVFQDLDDPPVAATFGEVMCTHLQGVRRGRPHHLRRRARSRPGRGAGLPGVHRQRRSARTATAHIIDVGVPVRVGGLVVASGDLLHGDRNGVTNIPLEIATEVADAAEEFVAAEAHVLDYVKGSGQKTLSELAVRRKAMGNAIATLRRQLSRA